MKTRTLIRLSALLSLLCLSTTILAQDFQRNYQLGAGGSIGIRNVSGNVTVTGYNGNAVIVMGKKEGNDRERVQIVDRSAGNRIEVGVEYPGNCHCDASVNFEVRVPRAFAFQYDSIASVSGDVHAQDITGDLHARSVSGEVTVQDVRGKVSATSVSGDVEVKNIAGPVSAKSTSGNVEVTVTSLPEGSDNLEFASVSGNVKVQMPENLNAQVEMSVLSGSLDTDFPLQIERREYGPGQKAYGTLGSGARRLKISSVSGNISLVR